MKLAYDDLKELVKEALVEILQEGLGNILLKNNQHIKYDDEFEEEMPKQKVRQQQQQQKNNQNMKSVSAPFNKQVSENVKKQPTLTSMYESKTLQKMGNHFEKQKSNENDKIGKKVIKSITDDPLMASIFADTAQTTLQEQLVAESKGAIKTFDNASRIIAQNDPSDIFGDDVANNWESLAFSVNDLKNK